MQQFIGLDVSLKDSHGRSSSKARFQGPARCRVGLFDAGAIKLPWIAIILRCAIVAYSCFDLDWSP